MKIYMFGLFTVAIMLSFGAFKTDAQTTTQKCNGHICKADTCPSEQNIVKQCLEDIDAMKKGGPDIEVLVPSWDGSKHMIPKRQVIFYNVVSATDEGLVTWEQLGTTEEVFSRLYMDRSKVK